jgi:hypothetical protein
VACPDAATNARYGTHRHSDSPFAGAQLAEPTVLRRELAFVTGKGGVGKTTVAAALALGAIVNGRKAVALRAQRSDSAGQHVRSHSAIRGCRDQIERGLPFLFVRSVPRSSAGSPRRSPQR